MNSCVKNLGYLVFFIVLTISNLLPNKSWAEDSLLTADPQKLARGIGHFERARSLLLAAVREFDTGSQFVSPDQVIDINLWRKTLLTRAEELETVLSPKPREIKAGSKYGADSRLLGARIKPKANIQTNSTVKPQIAPKTEAKDKENQIGSQQGLDLEIGGS